MTHSNAYRTTQLSNYERRRSWNAEHPSTGRLTAISVGHKGNGDTLHALGGLKASDTPGGRITYEDTGVQAKGLPGRVT